MLKLLFFLPCERVLINDAESGASIISVLEGVHIDGDDEIPLDVVVPMKWVAICLWHRTSTVENELIYEQKVEVHRPDGTLVLTGGRKIPVNNQHTNYRMVTNFPAFPVGQAGPVIIKLSLRGGGETTEWVEVATYPVNVTHQQRKVDDETPSTEGAQVG